MEQQMEQVLVEGGPVVEETEGEESEDEDEEDTEDTENIQISDGCDQDRPKFWRLVEAILYLLVQIPVRIPVQKPWFCTSRQTWYLPIYDLRWLKLIFFLYSTIRFIKRQRQDAKEVQTRG